ncbi:hypothetical protein CICLE_v10003974mg [Citrus x clementina]|uniref:NB-ARC domain-containing protein n=1 Tax=Citrus clementina TaxID=85681 RepID=V4T9Z9_CITCL|nr:hypothetical protein CICLE_v10003974mg [Citrus x clementina]
MEIVTFVVTKVAEYLVAPIIHPFTYYCTYKTNFEKLKNDVDKLKNARDSVQYKVDYDSKIKGDGIQQHIEEWLISVDEVISEVRKLIEVEEKSNNRCFNGLCPNLKTHYQLSKKAEMEVNAIVGLHEKRKFDSVSFRTIPEEIWLKSTEGFIHFESRKSTLKEILGSLSNHNFNMIGVYGMGGAVAQSKEPRNHKKQNILKGKKIGLRLVEEIETVRAGRLYERLKVEKKILIILYDIFQSFSGVDLELNNWASLITGLIIVATIVCSQMIPGLAHLINCTTTGLINIWGSLDLEAIGIPLADDNGGCKVLLTARSQDVLSCKMDCQQNFFVDVLNEKEAWSLFKKMTGDCIENGELKSVATKVVKECASLPIAIVPVAKALKNKSLYEWRNALLQLKRPCLRSFSGTQAVAYSTVELSYNHLEGRELKETFLLIGYSFICCVEDLLCYGMGLALFQNINTLEEPRDRALTLVDKLKNSCLLLDGVTSEWFAMHDVVRDVAISIASRDQHVFVVDNDVVPQIKQPDKDKLKVCTAISLNNSNISELPQELECPHLEYFSIGSDPSLRIPDNIFTEMTELRVLVLLITKV